MMMKMTKLMVLFLLITVGNFGGGSVWGQAPLGSAFTYQGRLNLSESPLDGTADFEFRLWLDGESGDPNNMVGSLVAVNNVSVYGGFFTVELDFGVLAFNGDNRWLEIGVRSPSGSGVFTTLSPRQLITATPYALQTRGIFVDDTGKVGIGTRSPQVAMHVAGNTLEGLPPSLVAGTLLLAQQNGGGNWAHMTILSGRNGRAQMNFGDADNDRQGAISYNNNIDVMDILVNGATKMRITDTGNVGIGTTAPEYPLHVVGSGGRTIQALNTGGPGTTYAVRGESTSIKGQGVFGRATALSGETYGVRGESYSSAGRGVYGLATPLSGFTNGVRGRSDSSEGRGVYGWATSPSGETYGVIGSSHSTSGTGMWGVAHAISGATEGVRGESHSRTGRGVYGLASHLTSGLATYGVLGESRSTGGRGVRGSATALSGSNFGVQGVSLSPDGTGVWGHATGWVVFPDGSVGPSGVSTGVRGSTGSPKGYGVYGSNANPLGYGVYCESRFHVEHRGTVHMGDTWPVTIGNEFQSRFLAGMRMSDDGFFDVTNDALNTSANYARLNSTGNWTVVSDRRLKRDIESLSGVLDKVMKLEPVDFRYKNDDSESNNKQIGFIAQDVRKQFPSLVTDGDVLTLNYAGLSVVAIGALQELHEMVEAKDAQIADLTARLERLENLLMIPPHIKDTTR